MVFKTDLRQNPLEHRLKSRLLGLPRVSDPEVWVDPRICMYNQFPGEGTLTLHVWDPLWEPLVLGNTFMGGLVKERLAWR